MASTASLGAAGLTNSEEAQQFYHAFNYKLQELRRQIEEATSAEQIQAVVLPLSEARAELTRKTQLLPTYDQQTHEQQLRQVNDLLAQKRTQLAPKARFAFKRGAKEGKSSKSGDVARSMTQEPAIGNGVASSGEAIETASAFRSIQDRHGENLGLEQLPAGLESDLHLLHLQDCVVDLRGTVSSNRILALQIRDLTRCVVLAGMIDGSAMMHNCRDCLFVLSCRQFRMHSSHSVVVFLSTQSIATIEHCSKIKFAPSDDSILGSVGEVQHQVPKVQDFDHVSTLTPSTSWSVMDSDAAHLIRQRLLHNHDAGQILSDVF